MLSLLNFYPVHYEISGNPDFSLRASAADATLQAIFAGIRKAGSVDSEKLFKAMRGLKFSTPFGLAQFRAIDQQSTMGAYVGKLDVRGRKGTMVDCAMPTARTLSPRMLT